MYKHSTNRRASLLGAAAGQVAMQASAHVGAVATVYIDVRAVSSPRPATQHALQVSSLGSPSALLCAPTFLFVAHTMASPPSPELAYLRARVGEWSALKAWTGAAARLAADLHRTARPEPPWPGAPVDPNSISLHRPPSTCGDSPARPVLLVLAAEAFEAERQDLLQRLEACAAPASEVHRLRQEARLRAQEVTTLQKARAGGAQARSANAASALHPTD